MRRFEGTRIVVTGGAQGIGKAIAVAFAELGGHIAIIDVAPESSVSDLLEELRGSGVTALYARADVSDETQVETAMARILEQLGGVDVLVNNAGTGSELSLEAMPVAEWDRVIGVNLRGTFLCTRAVLPGMLAAGRGSVINVASQLGQVGAPMTTHFSASKAGVIGLTKALAREVCRRGVRVNAVAPGPIETYALQKMSDEWKDAKRRDLPLGRFGTVDEVVPTILFLASDDASYYVGQTLCPNGGDVML